MKGCNLFKWLRWFLVLPLSLCFVILVNSLARSLFDVRLDQSLQTAVLRCVTMLIATIGSIFLAHLVAPSNKFRTSLVIASVWLLVLITCIIIVATGIGIGGSEQTILDGGISIASTVIGVLTGLFTVKKLDNNAITDNERLVKRVGEIEDLGGMTVNERLYVTKLDEQFYQALKTDHVKARQILTLLKVDTASIELILKQAEAN